MTNKELQTIKNMLNWSRISINSYYAITDVLEDEGLNGFEKNIEICSIITGLDESVFSTMSLAEGKEVFSALSFLNELDINKVHLPKRIKVDKYDLEIASDVSKLTVAQFSDWNIIVTGEQNMRYKIDKLLSIFLIPKGCTYNEGYDILDLQQVIRSMISFDVIQKLINFLLTKYLQSFRASLLYLVHQTDKMKTEKEAEALKQKIQEVASQMRFILISFS